MHVKVKGIGKSGSCKTLPNELNSQKETLLTHTLNVVLHLRGDSSTDRNFLSMAQKEPSQGFT